MKPSFALQFTDTGITLLHRTGRGWLPLGDAPLDDPALGDNLGYLRATALGLEPQGITTKLVIPNDQILYTKVVAPGPEAGKRRNQIRKALEGRTPYSVDDLVFDWSGNGPEVMVAVIARETLAEAEAFAASHRFNPMSFVALPDPANFDGEPFFGPSTHAASVLSAGDKVERDRPAMRIINRGEAARAAAARAALADQDLPLPAPEPAPEPAPVPAPEPVIEAVSAPVAAAGPPAADPVVAAPTVDGPAMPDLPTPAGIAPEPVAADAIAAPVSSATVASTTAASTTAAQEWQPASISAGTAPDLDLLPEAETDADLASDAPLAAVAPVAVPAAARFDLAATSADVPEAPAMFDVPMDDGDIPAMPHAVAAATFSSRRNGMASRLDTSVSEPVTPPRLGPVTQASAITAPSLPGTGGAELPVAPPARTGSKPHSNGKLADPRARLAASGKSGAQQGAIARYVPMKGKGASAALANAIARAGTTKAPAGTLADPAVDFTKRSLGTPATRQGKPRYLGLVLTVILLLFLAVVAVWSSYFIGDPTTTPAAEGGTPASGSAATAALDPPAQNPVVPAEPGAETGAETALATAVETASSGALIEPPEADAADSTADNTADSTLAADAVPLTDPTEPAAASAAGNRTGTGTAAVPAADATLSTSDQAATPDAAAVAPADTATAGPPAAQPTAAATETATGAPDPAASVSAVATPDPAEPATAASTPAPTAVALATPTPAPTAIAKTPAAEPPAQSPPAEAPPAEVPPARAPQADTDFAALLNGTLQDQGENLPELVGTEPGLQTGGAAVLAEPQALAGDSRPDTPLPPAPFGTFFERDAKGFVIATPEGAVTPEGALVIAGRPALVPPPRPGPRPGGSAATTDPAAADPAAATPEQPVLQSDPALAGFRPKPRPAAPVGPQDHTTLQVQPQIATASTVRPPERPATPAGFAAAAETGVAPDSGVTDASAPDSGALVTATNLAVAASRRPAPRPADLAASISAALASVEPEPASARISAQPVVEAALAPAARPATPAVTQPAAEPAAQPEVAAPEADNEPEGTSAAPAIPQNASVAKQATLANAINLGKLNLIGVYGTASNRRALVRLASGRYVRVKVGDRVDGGQVAAIGEQDLRYIKNGRNLLLSLPKDS